MNRLLLAGIFCASVIATAIARIGETLDECQVRYGGITGPPEGVSAQRDTYYFSKNGFTIAVIIVDGHVGSVTYSSPTPILDSAISVLLENNAQGSKWSVDDGATARAKSSIMRKEIIYQRADGKAEANYSEVGNYNGLQIRTKEFMRARNPQTEGM